MIDTINPMNFDITKNLHGHVRVETRDRWTGRVVDSQEKDNLVTNALQKSIMCTAWERSGNNTTGVNFVFGDYFPIWQKALGSVILFNSTITESASNDFLPSNAKVVAYAGQGSDSSNAMCGSYNSAESVRTSNGFTSVWDFLTSQGNGTIASLGRTSYRFPLSTLSYECSFGYNLPSNTLTNTASYIWIGYDPVNHWAYLAIRAAGTVDGVALKTSQIYRVPADFSSLGIFKSFMPPASNMVLVKELTNSDGTTSAAEYIYDRYENNLVYINGTTIHLIAVDGTHTTKSTSGTSGSTFTVTENYYWLLNNNTVYIISKANTSNVITCSAAGAIIYPISNDVVVVTNTGNTYSYESYVYPDGTVVQLPQITFNHQYPYRQFGPFVTNASYNASFWASPFYLGTIANLNSPVTKTSSQTMKITYTLTEA